MPPVKPVTRAMAGMAGPFIDALRRTCVGDHKDSDREVRASMLYEELRMLGREELERRYIRNGLGFGRQSLIAAIIEQEVPRREP